MIIFAKASIYPIRACLWNDGKVTAVTTKKASLVTVVSLQIVHSVPC